MIVTLQTYSGNYLVADKGGGAELMASSTTPSTWGDIHALRSRRRRSPRRRRGDAAGSLGQWASAVNGGGGVINVTATAETAFEKFSIVKLSGTGAIGDGDKIALKTTVSGQFLSAKDAGGSTVSATAPEALEWETLTLGITETSGAGGGGGAGGGPGETTPPTSGPTCSSSILRCRRTPSSPRSTRSSRSKESNHFGEERYAYFFKPGKYDLDVQVGFT